MASQRHCQIRPNLFNVLPSCGGVDAPEPPLGPDEPAPTAALPTRRRLTVECSALLVYPDLIVVPVVCCQVCPLQRKTLFFLRRSSHYCSLVGGFEIPRHELPYRGRIYSGWTCPLTHRTSTFLLQGTVHDSRSHFRLFFLLGPLCLVIQRALLRHHGHAVHHLRRARQARRLPARPPP